MHIILRVSGDADELAVLVARTEKFELTCAPARSQSERLLAKAKARAESGDLSDDTDLIESVHDLLRHSCVTPERDGDDVVLTWEARDFQAACTILASAYPRLVFDVSAKRESESDFSVVRYQDGAQRSGFNAVEPRPDRADALCSIRIYKGELADAEQFRAAVSGWATIEALYPVADDFDDRVHLVAELRPYPNAVQVGDLAAAFPNVTLASGSAGYGLINGWRYRPSARDSKRRNSPGRIYARLLAMENPRFAKSSNFAIADSSLFRSFTLRGYHLVIKHLHASLNKVAFTE